MTKTEQVILAKLMTKTTGRSAFYGVRYWDAGRRLETKGIVSFQGKISRDHGKTGLACKIKSTYECVLELIVR